LLKKDEKRWPSLLVQFIFAYVENTYVSKDWWDSLSQVNRAHLSSMAWVSNAYYAEFQYSPSTKIVPWRITRVVT